MHLPTDTQIDSLDMSVLDMHLRSLETILKQKAILFENESLVEKLIVEGGNMNLTLRVRTTERSLILKQAFPYCYKYPSIPAPEKRLEIESIYYDQLMASPELYMASPSHCTIIPERNMLVMEDLGASADLTRLYSGKKLARGQALDLCSYLNHLHSLPFSDLPILHNQDMKKLNHEYVFTLPLTPNNQIDLDSIQPGLQAIGDALKNDVLFVKTVHELGQSYLSLEGRTLLHGDFYPASWLDTPDGIKVIDHEFAFYGEAEFDLGVFLAHMILAEQSNDIFNTIKSNYTRQIAWPRALQFAGVEVMRRLLGVARISEDASLAKKESWLSLAQRLVISPEKSDLLG